MNLPVKKAAPAVPKLKGAGKRKGRKALARSYGDIDPEDPAVQGLQQEICVLGAYVTQEVDKRCKAAGLEATVFFRVVLKQPKINPNPNSGV